MRHFTDINEGDPEDDEQMVVEEDVMDVRLRRPDVSSDRESMEEPRGNMPRRVEIQE